MSNKKYYKTLDEALYLVRNALSINHLIKGADKQIFRLHHMFSDLYGMCRYAECAKRDSMYHFIRGESRGNGKYKVVIMNKFDEEISASRVVVRVEKRNLGLII